MRDMPMTCAVKKKRLTRIQFFSHYEVQGDAFGGHQFCLAPEKNVWIKYCLELSQTNKS